MNIKQIRYFVGVVERGSLSAAAKELYVTVQAVSKAIADLERELGNGLFVRESRGVHPTSFGKVFYQRATPVLKEFDELEKFAKGYHSNEPSNSLRLALRSPAFYGHEQARASIAAFAKKGLAIDTTVALETRAGGLAGLRSGDYDALITIGSFSDPEFDCVPVGTIGIGVLMAKNHPLASHESVRFADLTKYPVAKASEFDSFNNAVDAMYRKHNFEASFASIDRHNIVQFLMVEQGLCFSVGIPALGEMYPGTVVRSVEAADAVPVPICLVSPKEHKSPVYLAFERWLASALLILGGVTPAASTL